MSQTKMICAGGERIPAPPATGLPGTGNFCANKLPRFLPLSASIASAALTFSKSAPRSSIADPTLTISSATPLTSMIPGSSEFTVIKGKMAEGSGLLRQPV